MGKKLNEEIRRAIARHVRPSDQRRESAVIQTSHLWQRLKKEVSQGVETINGAPESRALAGGLLGFEEIESDLEFRVKNEGLPGRMITVRNCDTFLSVETVSRQVIKGEVAEEEDGSEELCFGADKSGDVYLKSKQSPKLCDAEDVAVYLFRKFWTT